MKNLIIRPLLIVIHITQAKQWPTNYITCMNCYQTGAPAVHCTDSDFDTSECCDWQDP